MPHNAMLRHSLFMTLVCAAFLPAAVQAEGARRVLACETTVRCDAAGQCTAHKETVEFRMEPKALNADGSGEFVLQQGDEQVPMQALSEVGPFVWTRHEDRYTLLASSETEFLLHTLSLPTSPKATIQFMSCEFRQ